MQASARRVPPQSGLEFMWSARGPIPGLHCLHFNEPSDPHTWNDNFLWCAPSYFVGAGTHPGAGIPGVVGSAKATAALMLDDLRRS